ncbi:MAG TPA: dihydrodipicolinate reductase C-terminal domain-containing protein [Bryobacteraceae bacterium]|nr:dihydrodipicolinate reductase C-terminal domain-containing protein [Bryobacteraceae bacterium]
MKLAIVGYGKMGRLIEQLAPEYGFTVHARIDLNDDFELARGADAAIEFTVPDAVAENVEKLAALGVPVAVGTTGWAWQSDRVKQALEKHGTGLVWSPNFSIGVNVFTRLVREAAKLLANEPQYGAWAWEIHHHTKKDAPSGTLIKLVEEMKNGGYGHAISIASNRAGAHPGTHEIGFDSAADTITLRHAARSRDGFARGALKAAQWVIGKKGVHEFSEILFER